MNAGSLYVLRDQPEKESKREKKEKKEKHGVTKLLQARPPVNVRGVGESHEIVKRTDSGFGGRCSRKPREPVEF